MVTTLRSVRPYPAAGVLDRRHLDNNDKYVAIEKSLFGSV